MLDRKGLEDAESTRDVMAEQPAAPVNAYEEDRRARKGLTKAADAPGESAEADLVHAIRKDPRNVPLYMKLAELYKASREFGKSIDQLNKALELSPDSGEIRELILDVQLMQLREDAAEAQARARANPGKERLVEKAKALHMDVVQKEVEYYQLGVELNPTDLKKKFELGQRLASKTVKQFSKAIPLLQQASANPNLKVDSLVLLGECFAREGKNDLARRQLEKAVDGLDFADRPEAFKAAHYLLGRIYQAAGKGEQAEHHYGEVLSVDYDYKDVLKRLDEMGGGSSGAMEE
jgi:tetratricopeptide (TPR) repeat protein